MSRPTLGPSHLPIQRVPSFFPIGKAPGHEVNHSPPLSAKVRMNEAMPLLPPYAFMLWTQKTLFFIPEKHKYLWFQVSEAVKLLCCLLWMFTLHRQFVVNQCFGTSCWCRHHSVNDPRVNDSSTSLHAPVIHTWIIYTLMMGPTAHLWYQHRTSTYQKSRLCHGSGGLVASLTAEA